MMRQRCVKASRTLQSTVVSGEVTRASNTAIRMGLGGRTRVPISTDESQEEMLLGHSSNPVTYDAKPMVYASSHTDNRD